MQIQEQDIDSLVPYEFNNRNHSEEQVNRIANSIKEFGFNQPIVIDESNIVLVGHGRLFAAKKLGLKKVPTIKLNDLSETQKKAYRILDNKLQNDSTWSFNNLELELGYLEDESFKLEPWGLNELYRFFGEETENNPEDEWKDMPLYESEDENAYHSIKIHFLSEESLSKFAKLINQKLTNKTKSIWYPEQLTRNLKNIRIDNEHS